MITAGGVTDGAGGSVRTTIWTGIAGPAQGDPGPGERGCVLAPQRTSPICMAMQTATTPTPVESAAPATPSAGSVPAPAPKEIGGPSGPDPTRYGDWERNGRCIDF